MYTTNNHKPDRNKVATIAKMPAPTSKIQVQSFI